MNNNDWGLHVEYVKALADETRLQITAMLSIRECCVCELSTGLKKTQPSISQHLKKLKYAGLVNERKSAAWVFYSLRDDLPEWIQLLLTTTPSPDKYFQVILDSGLQLPCEKKGGC